MNTRLAMPRLRFCVAAGALLLIAAGCSSASRTTQPDVPANPSVVARIGNEVVTLEKFEEQYAKTVGGRQAASDDSLAEYRDFLTRYVNFRLKVRAAEDAGYATDSSIVEEINTYRTSLARPYLVEQQVLEPVLRELYERQNELIDASHIMVRLGPEAAPEDTLAAYQRIAALRDSLEAGADFGDLAFRQSEDPSASDTRQGPGYRGRLGFFTAGRMVESFEDMAYTTPVGEISPIFRSRFGYHILKVHDRREAVPAVKLAHIMTRPAGATPADSAEALARIRALRQRVLDGEAFAEVARAESDDRGSRPRGGEIGTLNFDQPVFPAFKEAAFALEKPGDISEVVETPVGYHVIQLMEREEKQSFEASYERLKALATRLNRTQEAEERFAQDVRAQHGSDVNMEVVNQVIGGMALDTLWQKLTSGDIPEAQLSQPFASIGDSSYTFHDLATFLRHAQVRRVASNDAQLTSLIDQFLTDRAIAYEAAVLEREDPEFARLMREFRDGLMLFRLMEESVWNAATADSAGLEAYYNAHREAYRFPDRTRVVALKHASDSVLVAALAQLREGTDLVTLVQQGDFAGVQVDTVMLAEASGSVYDRALGLSPGTTTDVLRADRGFVILKNDGVEPARMKTFREARPEVVSDYQKSLEEALLARLRARYGVETYPERLSAAFRDGQDDQATAPVSVQH